MPFVTAEELTLLRPAITGPKKLQLVGEARGWRRGTLARPQSHIFWRSGQHAVGFMKPGKETSPDFAAKYRDGRRGPNMNDMRPTIWRNGRAEEMQGSFDDIFHMFQDLASSQRGRAALELIAVLLFRNAYLLDHQDQNGSLRYFPSEAIVRRLRRLVRTIGGVPVEAYLQYLEAITWNEDVKYDTLGYEVRTGTGRTNNLMTYVHLIAVLLGKASLARFCSGFARPPAGVSPMSQKQFREIFLA